MKIGITLLFSLFSVVVTAQTLFPLVDGKVITVNSQTSIYANSNTRRLIEIELPTGTIAYVYRVAVISGSAPSVGESLISLLSAIPSDELTKGAIALSSNTMQNANNGSVDMFVFSQSADASAFLNKADASWFSPKQAMGVKSTVEVAINPISPKIWFGFRNNNFSDKVDVRLDVVAILDETITDPICTFEFVNPLNEGVKFSLSFDRVEWAQVSLGRNEIYQNQLPLREIHVRIPRRVYGYNDFTLHYSEKGIFTVDQRTGDVILNKVR